MRFKLRVYLECTIKTRPILWLATALFDLGSALRLYFLIVQPGRNFGGSNATFYSPDHVSQIVDFCFSCSYHTCCVHLYSVRIVLCDSIYFCLLVLFELTSIDLLDGRSFGWFLLSFVLYTSMHISETRGNSALKQVNTAVLAVFNEITAV